MYFRKLPHPANFEFVRSVDAKGRARAGRTPLDLDVTSFADDVYRVRARGKAWPKNYSQAGLTPPPKGRGATRIELSKPFGLRIVDGNGHALLTSIPGMTFGVSGPASMFLFDHEADHHFYGMGEKLRGLELSGVQTKFWNTDVFADFYWKEVIDDRPDPLYASIPYLIVKRGNTYVGLLLDNPHATFMSTSSHINIANQMKRETEGHKSFILGAENGQPDLYILVGPSLPELTRKLQSLVGRTPLPPAWALGYHQCRWGYRDEKDLRELDGQFTKHGIPCDGLWLDIDYMVDFKVFTLHPGHFKKPKATFRDLAAKGRKVIPIIDPGVKLEPGYSVYDDGRKAKAYCKNPQGTDFVGLVWPGRTVFPDFSLPKARAWWAKHVAAFAKLGIRGAWIDMNDPSTGSVQNDAMLFDNGRLAHDVYHNQYALGMAMATRDGFQAAHPGKRPFVLSRSGFTGMAKYAAIWTGDNNSNYHYLRMSIPCSLNLALSGVPFNGPDIGGFAGDTTPQLITDWMKACFLFPFCRNHSMTGTRQQEPWAFDEATLHTLRHYIRLRYKLRPYLYNLFALQEETGEALLRPLFYDFADSEALPLAKVDDQFLVGPSILQAPLLEEDRRERDVVLPGPARWYSASEATWIPGGRRVKAQPAAGETALYVREGSILPMEVGDPTDAAFNPSQIECHIFLDRSSTTRATGRHIADDGDTYAYRKGRRTVLEMSAHTAEDGIDITLVRKTKGYGNVDVTVVLYDHFQRVRINGVEVKTRAATWTFAGRAQDVVVTAPVAAR